MKKNRILALLMAMVMVVGLLPMAAMAAGEPVTFTVEADKATVDQDGTVNFTVYVQTTAPVGSIQVYLDIPAGMTYVEDSGVMDAGAKAALGMNGNNDDCSFAKNPQTGKLQIGVGGEQNIPVIGKTKVMTFSCTAVKGGDFNVSIEVEEVTDGDFSPVEVALVPAAVHVNKTSYTASEIDLAYTGTLAIADKDFNGTVAPSTWKVTDKDDADNPVDWPAAELAKAEWSVDKAWAKVENGTVSITDVAAAEAGNITVTVKIGGETKTATVAVTKAAAAVTEVKGVAANATTALIPAAGAAANEYTYAVEVFDQYGAKMTGETVTWTAGTLPTGVTFDAATGKLSVAAGATAGEVTLTATVGAKTLDVVVKVTDITFEGVDSIKTKAGVYGNKLSDLVSWGTLTAKTDAAVAGTFSLKEDTMPAAGEAAYEVVFNSTDKVYQDVTVATGTVTIAKKAVTVTAKDVDVKVGSDVADIEYGYTNTALVGDDALSGTATYTVYSVDSEGNESVATVSTAEPADYIIKVSGLTASDNYELTFVNGALTVKKKNSTPPPIGTGTKPGEPTGGNQGNNDPVDKTPTFEDVTAEDWFYEAVEFVADKGLFNGTSETTFAPNANMNRAMVATVLFRLDGAEKADVAAAFEDVEADTWYTDGVAWAAEKGVVTGYSDTVFAPNDDVTREQLAVMLYRYVGSPEVDAEMGMAGFADVDAISDWAADAMRWAVQNGIINGMGDGTLAPQGNATRAMVATMFQRFVNLDK